MIGKKKLSPAQAQGIERYTMTLIELGRKHPKATLEEIKAMYKEIKQAEEANKQAEEAKAEQDFKADAGFKNYFDTKLQLMDERFMQLLSIIEKQSKDK